MITKVFRSGNSQAVRIPKELYLPEGDVEILRRGDELVIRPVNKRNASVLLDLIGGQGEGDICRVQPPAQERDFDPD